MSKEAMPNARHIALSNAENLHIPALVNWLFAEEIRSLAARKKSASFSIPMKRRPVLAHATPVVPLPIELSKTVWPSLEYVRIRYSMSSAGFCVGWIVFLTVPNGMIDSGHRSVNTFRE